MIRALVCLCILWVGLAPVLAAPPGRTVRASVKFKLSPADLEVYVARDTGLDRCITDANGNTTLNLTSPLLIYFVARAKKLEVPEALSEPAGTDLLQPHKFDGPNELHRAYATSAPVTLNEADVDRLIQEKSWPFGSGEVYQMTFSPEAKAFRQKDLLALYAPGFILTAGLLVTAVGFYEFKIRRPGLVSKEEKLRHQATERFLTLREELKDQNIGAILGNYRVTDFLGSGGMARVYRGVYDATLDESKPVAIKLMSHDTEGLEEFRKRFFREADVGLKLSHPNVVRILDYSEHQNIMYMVMEYVAGKTLRAFIPLTGMSGADIWKYLEPIFSGLQYVHDRGVVHRDLKPENIMVTPSGRVVLMDFGLARRHDFSMLTASGGIMGTPAYMAPEQVLGQATDGRCDQYAIGILCYEMIAGGSPYPNVTDPIQLLMKHIHDEPLPIRNLRPDVSQELEQVLLKMLSRHPESRFPSMGACAAALGPLLTKLERPA